MLGKCARWCHNKSVGLLVLRVSLGAFFLAHGIAKFQNMELMVDFFASLGLASFWVYVVAVSESLAGAMLIVGAFSWVAAAMITVDMAVAIFKVTGPNPQGQDFLPHFVSGWGTNLIYAAAALCIAWCGAGRWSLTAMWLRRKGMACRDCKADHGMGHNCPDCKDGHEASAAPQA